MKNYKIFLLGMLLVLLTACSGESNNELGDQVEQQDVEAVTVTEENKENATIFVPNEDGSKLVEKDIEIDEAKGETKEKKIVDSLKEVETGNKDYTRAIREDIEVNSVVVKGTVAIVDISSKNLSGGAAEENILVNSVVLSLLEQEGIESVQFLVDGEKKETLMGHIYIEEPLTKEDVITTSEE